MKDRNAPAKPGQAIDLAVVPDFALGVLRVQPSLRRVSVGGRAESVEPRVMQALIALADAGGSVVSRDELIDRCWGGRIVGDDAINRCIAKVRRLAETAEPPAFLIETVSRVGYRLELLRGLADEPAAIDPALALFVERAAPPPEHPTAVRPATRSLRWLGVGLAMIAFAGLAFWYSRPAARWTVQGSRQLPRLDGESRPSISPDGSLLAYTASTGGGNGPIVVQNLRSGTSVAVSPPDENADSAVWAADGARLAYVLVGRESQPCRIMVQAFPGGAPHLAGWCQHLASTRIAWQPRTSYIFLEDRTPVLEGQLAGFFNAIFRIDTETGRSEQVTSSPISEGDYAPRVSPDGQWLAYLRDRGWQGRALRLRKLASSEERELDSDPDVNEVDWTSDSHTLIAIAPGQMSNQILAYPIDGTAGYRLYASASGLDSLATGPSGMLALAVSDQRTNLARASRTPHATADIFDPAAGLTDWPAFAPDGTLAFVSNRSGEMALWTRKPGSQPNLLLHFGLHDIERPAWSPDGSRIAFLEAWKGEATIHVVTEQGKEIVSFAVPSVGYGNPNWTPDGQHLVMFDKRILRAVQVDLRNPDHREPAEAKYRDGITYRNGATYSTSALTSGIWQLNGGVRLVTADYPAERRARLAFLGDDVLLPDSRAGGNLRILAQPLKGGPARPAFYAPAAETETPLVVDPRTGDVIYVSDVAADSHIDLLTIARQ